MCVCVCLLYFSYFFFFFKQKTAYEMRISDWSSDVCSSDLMAFFFEVLIGGLMAGVMYSLVALGFVLIFKASGVFNFAQGAMVLFAGLFFVGFIELGVPLWISLILTIAVMVLLAGAIERLVLRHLVNPEGIILFMATIGVSFFLDGLVRKRVV